MVMVTVTATATRCESAEHAWVKEWQGKQAQPLAWTHDEELKGWQGWGLT